MPVLDKRQVRRAFSRAAASYDEVAVVQRHVVAELSDRLAGIRHQPTRILEAGSGTGHGARELRRLYPKATVLCLDLALPMLQHAARQRGWFGRERYVAGDMEQLPLAAGAVDMVFSSSSLHWCRLERTFAEFARVMAPASLLMFATFGPDTLAELRDAWRDIDDGVHVHGLTDMHDIGDELVRQGFADPVLDVDRLRVTYRDTDGLMRDLKALGSINADPARARGLTGKGKLTALRRTLQSRRNAEGLLECSYEIIYGHAWAPIGGQRRESDGAVAVPLSGLVRR